jgi:membrane protease YdiL (CAAX protease family)
MDFNPLLSPACEPWPPPPAAAELVRAEPARPRVWTAFVAVVLAVLSGVVFQFAAAIVLALWLVSQGVTPGELGPRLVEQLTTPEMIVGMAMLPAQAAMLLTALLAAWLSPVPLKQRLGLVRPRAPAWAVCAWIAGSIIPVLLGLATAYGLAEIIEPDPTIAQIYEKMIWDFAVPFVLFIALAPGFAEEFLFRGYMQRRLIERWSAAAGILITSVIFAVAHLMPHTVVFAFPIGIWLGLMAWRTGSVWPGVISHALINGLWNVWQAGQALDQFPESFPIWLLIPMAAIGLAAAAIACWEPFARRKCADVPVQDRAR